MTAGLSRCLRILIHNRGNFLLQVLKGRTHAGETVGPKPQALPTDMTISPQCWSNSIKYCKHSTTGQSHSKPFSVRTLFYSSDCCDYGILWVKSSCHVLLLYYIQEDLLHIWRPHCRMHAHKNGFSPQGHTLG